MATKLTDTCLAKCADDEPIFVLRAQDKLAPSMVRTWAATAAVYKCDPAKVQEAYELADKMDAWQRENADKAKYPD